MFTALHAFQPASYKGRVGDLEEWAAAVAEIPNPAEIVAAYVTQQAIEYGQAAYQQVAAAVGGGDIDPKTVCEQSGIGMKYVPGVGCVAESTPVEMLARQLECASRGMQYREYDANGQPVVAGCVPMGTAGAEPAVVLGGGTPVQPQGGAGQGGGQPGAPNCVYKGANGSCWTSPCGGKFTRFNPAGTAEAPNGGCECLPGYEWVDPSSDSNYDCKKSGAASPEGGKSKDTSYLPWILGGVAVLAVGGALVMTAKKKPGSRAAA